MAQPSIGSWTPVLDAPLRGREQELGRLVQVLDRAAAGEAGGLAVTGLAGEGKTALLGEAAHRAQMAGFAVVSTVGRPVLRELVYAGLSGVLRPLLGQLDDLTVSQADVLRGALGLDDHAASALAVANASLGLLARASEQQPVFVVVDDAHWVDRASLAALLFVAHQAEAERLALVFAFRTGESDLSAEAGLPTVELGDLDGDSARLLLVDQRAPDDVAHRCWQLSGGNPLALLEGFSGLTAPQRAGAAELPPILPMGDRLLDALTRRMGHLPPATAAALAVAAVDTTGDLVVVTRALARAGGSLDDLLVAERDGIVGLADNCLTWRHPLFRTAVLVDAAPEQVRAAHRAIADTLPPTQPEERRLWHLAESLAGQDESVASHLSTAASRAVRRGALPAAAAAYTQAARLSPDDADARRRLFDAAVCHFSGGELETAVLALRRLLDATADATFAAEIADVLGRAEMWMVGPSSAVRLLEHHAEAVRATSPRLSAVLLLRAAVTCLVGLDPDHAVRATTEACVAAEASGDMDATIGAWALRTIMATFAGDPNAAAGVDALEQVMDLAVAGLDRDLADGADAVAQLCAYALVIHGRPEPALRALQQVLQYSTTSGRTGIGVLARVFRTEALWRQGRWNDALSEITQAISVQEASGMRDLVPLAQAMAARVLAGLGRADDAEAHVEAALATSLPRGLDLTVAWALSGRGLLHLGAGRFSDAVAALDQVASRAAHLRQAGWLWWTADQIEALHGAGRTDEAVVLLDGFAPDTSDEHPSWVSGARLRSRALLGLTDPEMGYGAALDTFTTIDVPFERARTLLLRGRHRIGAGDGVRGYRDLAEARSVFERLGAVDWVERTSATGDERQATATALTARLSPKELPVALLVGSGATDRAAADELFISTKTVGYHLGNIYRKLGIHNRTQLAALVAAEQAGGRPMPDPGGHD